MWRLDPTAQRLEFLALGYRPIPLAAGGKTPPKAFPLADYLSGAAPITPATIAEWAQRWPEATNTGLLCGGDLVVIDADNAAIVRYLDTIGLPMTPVVETSRGQHYYFKRPAWLTTSQTGEGAPLPGLDAKATGYVVAPGSLHPSSAEYRALVPLDAPLAELPEWLADMLRRNAAPAPATPPTPAQTTSAPGVTGLVAAIEAALGVTRFNAAGFSNNVPCPFHDDRHASATWTRDGGGQLFCHAGCKPQSRHTSHGRVTFGVIDTARALGIPLQATSTPAPAGAGLGRTPDGGGGGGVSGIDPHPAHEAEAVFFRTFFTPLLSLFTKGAKSAKNKNTKGRRAATFYMGDLEALTRAAQGLTYRPLKAAEIANARLYRALAYAPVTAGIQRRATMAKRVGVTARTAIEYDKIARVGVTQRVIRRDVTEHAALELPARRKDAPRNVWLESTAGRKFKPTRAGLRDAIAESVQYNGRAVAIHCTQGANFYTPPERDGAPQGLPVQFRRVLIKAGYGAYARLLDALLLAGVQHGDELTTLEAIALVARYGVGAATVRRALADVAARVAHPDLTAAPQAVPSATVPAEVTEDHAAPGESVDHAPAQLALGGDQRAGPACACGKPATEHKLTGWYCADHAPGAVARARGAA